MELVESAIDKVLDKLPPFEATKNSYSLPIPAGTKVHRIERVGPSHTGPYRGAIDYVVDLGTPVVAMLDGEVIKAVDENDKYGPTQEFEPYSNYVVIKHPNDEFSQLVHLEKGS